MSLLFSKLDNITEVTSDHYNRPSESTTPVYLWNRLRQTATSTSSHGSRDRRRRRRGRANPGVLESTANAIRSLRWELYVHDNGSPSILTLGYTNHAPAVVYTDASDIVVPTYSTEGMGGYT